ncbi:MAG: hypothetical protein VR74_12440 [Hyphomonas sp. BRH_c22]|uniref:hypothetical protein n=1 Tax=Hyphomonas sp. BRH_c22 TaxID=1629710 RepID=UPI0005F196D1|nr:hypothetical protein [Hyphomonas sp. BRH_c22]KJS36636.1 MAG: hypothetical protein VR74_12440 [Hyphomonas sp. BRH_c22]
MTQQNWQKWLTDRWFDFHHSYTIKAKTIWTCTSLRDASQKYMWNNQDRGQTNSKLDDYSRLLHQALETQDNDETEKICKAILEWGGVGQNPKQATPVWIANESGSGSLAQAICNGLDALHAGDAGFFSRVRPMDSAATKIMALADSGDYGVIIYDSRVAAALAYLARQYLLEIGATEVPPELCFPIPPWRIPGPGLGRHRNPSLGTLRFPKTGSTIHRFRIHAEGKILASSLIANVARATEVTSRDWEQALFMVGHDLPRDQSQGSFYR